jgi:hypothetical protein
MAKQWEVHWVRIVSPGSPAEDRRDRVNRYWTRWGAERAYLRIVDFAIFNPEHNDIYMTRRDGADRFGIRPPLGLR